MRIVAALGVAVLVTARGWGRDIGSDPVGRIEFSVLVYDLAHVGSKTLKQAEGIGIEIFSNAGVNVRFATASVADRGELLTDFTVPPARGCAHQPLSSAVLRAQILSHAPAGLPRETLGYSLPCARRGVQVTLFADRIEDVSHNTYACFYRVLGHALAHEVGHVLLRSEAHTHEGLMKARWTRSDWQRAAVLAIGFNSEQQQRITDELRSVQASGDLDTANANVISSAGRVSAKRPFGTSD
jgi:hypothetical protein